MALLEWDWYVSCVKGGIKEYRTGLQMNRGGVAVRKFAISPVVFSSGRAVLVGMFFGWIGEGLFLWV
jgi:hypothetical protein